MRRLLLPALMLIVLAVPAISAQEVAVGPGGGTPGTAEASVWGSMVDTLASALAPA